MNAMAPTTRADFDSPATYRICVRGAIPARWCDRLESMIVTEEAPKAEPPTSVLLGELVDQAALAGVLATLYELHLVVISVELLRE